MHSNKFQSWLENYGGAEKLAAKLGVTPRVVQVWEQRGGWPRIQTILDIVKISRGALTIEDVIYSTKRELKRTKTKSIELKRK